MVTPTTLKAGIGSLENQFLAAWTDSVAGVSCFSNSITTEDLFEDGYRLVIAGEDSHLKVWNGRIREVEQKIDGEPVGLVSFHVQNQAEVRLAVASGADVYIFIGLKPHYKASIPLESIHDEDAAVWQSAAELPADSVDARACVNRLRVLSEAGIPLCRRSRRLEATSDDITAAAYIAAWRGLPLADPPYITVISKLYVLTPESSAAAMPVVGHEAAGVALLDNSSFAVKQSWELEGVPAFINVVGALETTYTIFVTLRSPFVSIIRDGEPLPRRIALAGTAVATVVIGASFYAATGTGDGGVLEVFDAATAARHTTVALPVAPVAAAALPHSSAQLVAVAMRDCAVVVYNGATAVSRHTTADVVLGMFGGPLMTEESALVCTLENGGLDVRFLSRKLRRQASKAPGEAGGVSARAAEDDAPLLPVPKKSKLFIEFAKRERENAQAMYHTFQQDLLKVRLKVAEAYVKVLTGAQSDATGQNAPCNRQLSLNGAVNGLGPMFQLVIQVTNRSKQLMYGLKLAAGANAHLYHLPKTCTKLPALVPGLQYSFQIDVICKEPETGCAGDVSVRIVREGSCMPAICAVVAMPVSELDDA
eukprot:jgi/Ulvmu1/4024/UM189_0008.1